MDNTIGVLEQLRQLRERALEDVTGKLARQKQLCQRYSNNIQALSRLSDVDIPPRGDAAQMSNQARFRANIQRVIDWQKQEQALATLHEQALQRELVEQACREKTLSVVLDRQRAALNMARQQQEQKQTDGQAMQSWLRRRASR